MNTSSSLNVLENTATDRPELQKAIQAFVHAGFAGLQLRVNDQRGEWVGSAGVRQLGELTPPSTDGSFWVGSVTKTFTATLVLQLVAEGKLQLDTPVAGVLPELELDERITVRMLLNHTSGLFNYTGEYYPDGRLPPASPPPARTGSRTASSATSPRTWSAWPSRSRPASSPARTGATQTPTTRSPSS